MVKRRTQGMRGGLGGAAFVAAFGWLGHAFADPASPAAAAASDQQKADKQTELRGVEDTIRASEDQRRRIESDIETIRADRARLSASLIETTAKVQESERGVVAADDRLVSLSAEADALAHSLESRRGVIADVLAALQRMGANPPPAILVKPHDMSEAVRAATLLGSVIPGLKSETEALRRDMDNLAKTRESIARERDDLANKAAALALEKIRLAALIDARQKSLASAQDALGSQQRRATELSKQATSLKDLISRLDSENASRRAAANAALAADAQAAAEIEARAAVLRGSDPVRLKSETAFGDAKGRVPLPVAGTILKAFGSSDGLGGTERGVSMTTLPGATVSAPADGAVLFSGPYRTYGQLLIIDAGGGYYVLLAGMDRINVSSGEFVLAGEPIGAMGDGSVRTAAAIAVGAARPVLYIELRKDGTAIDPGPWWAKSDIEKARG
jgi:murein hydrolase activator